MYARRVVISENSENKVTSEDTLFAQERSSFYLKSNKHKLSSASLTEELFWMLIEISPLHSEKVIWALRDFLVFGYTRREVCEIYNVSRSYFSISLGRISHVNNVVSSLVLYYNNAHRASRRA